MGLVAALIIVKIEIARWQSVHAFLLLASLFLLIVVLIPGIGHTVNGSTRWVGFGIARLQVSEFAKLALIVYLASYLVRHQEEVRTCASGFIKPLVVLAVMSLLLLKEPDFGAVVVITATVMALLFLAGVRLWQFVLLLVACAVIIVVLAISSPYRLERLTGFLNPWARQFDSGYQLTQSLIAFGRGGWFGVGLGESVQKLFYLPEAHTDFLLAVLAEELGLMGVLTVIGLFVLLVSRGLLIARRALHAGNPFAAYLAYGFSLLLALQAAINIGVNSGLLPTKGLTLPLMSYGGSSMVANCIVIAILVRIDYETRWQSLGGQIQ